MIDKKNTKNHVFTNEEKKLKKKLLKSKIIPK